ncbi:pyridoxamine 5'-phosphate oxidase family protein [Tissierella praeacuta]|uniref:pyridoxamine 5'-phosphate oxidase family protein n=1 Tax=Tissierella praeacuta TaxID=43131 RepID=UPI00333EAC2C
MKTHQLTDEKIKNLLLRVQTGSFSTINTDGTSYITLIHFVYMDNQIYIHGLSKGQKIDNSIRNDKIGFLAYDMQGLPLDPNGVVCDTNTEYESVIITGNATLVEDIEAKRIVLQNIVQKYTPHLADSILPEPMIKGIAVIQINILEVTGKYYN